MDTRDTGPYGNDSFEDPSVSSLLGIFTGTLHHYLHAELEANSYYTIFSEEAYRHWHSHGNGLWAPVNFMPVLKRALLSNPSLKIYVGCGYYDCATPFATAEYSFNRLGLSPSHRSNIYFSYYEGGHMYYLNPSIVVTINRASLFPVK